MALWEFTTFTVLIGALIVHAAIISRRLALADPRLTRMEEALLFLARSGSVNVTEPELPEIPAKPQVSAQEEARRVYLTMRDLRARSEQRATFAPSPDPLAESREALEPAPEPTHAPEAVPELEDAVATRSETLAATSSEPTPTLVAPPASSEPAPSPPAIDEPVGQPATATLSENAAATILETGETPVTNTERQSPPNPDDRPPNDAAAADDAAAEEAAARKSQEILVFLSAQRRRRRARLGY
jgi:hypothetical protein